MKGDKVSVIKGDHHSIGYKTSHSDFEFTDHEITVDAPMSSYLTTDGFLDQNGGPKGFPFGKKRFKALIEEYNMEGMADQQELFLQELTTYQGDEIRNDAITLVAFKVHPTEEKDES